YVFLTGQGAVARLHGCRMDSRRFAHRNRWQRARRQCSRDHVGEIGRSLVEKGPLTVNFKFDWNRRSFLTALVALTGGLFAPAGSDAASLFGKKHKPSGLDGHPIVPITSGLGSTSDIYSELGVTPLVNVNGTVTVIGGSVMRPEVMELMRRGNEHFVLID